MGRKKELPYQEKIKRAAIICKPFDCIVERSTDMFEVAKVKGDGVSLVIYPHKTSAGNYHLRVRNNGSKNPDRAISVMKALDSADGLPKEIAERVRYSSTFSSHWRSLQGLRTANQDDSHGN